MAYPHLTQRAEWARCDSPDCWAVYVDNNPIVLSHARALLTSTPEGACAYVDADLRDPDTILAAATATLDFCRPVAVLLLSVLHLVPEDALASQVVTRLVAECVPGSHLTISHPASDIDAKQTAEATRRLNQAQVAPAKTRDRNAIAALFTGLDLVPPAQPPPAPAHRALQCPARAAPRVRSKLNTRSISDLYGSPTYATIFVDLKMRSRREGGACGR